MAGRPTKYNSEAQAKADKYVDGGFTEKDDVVPSRAGLCLYLNVDRETLTNWGKVYPEFFGTLERLRSMQEHITLNGGLKGNFNSTIAKLLLANHGYSDKQAVDHTTGGKEIQPNRIEIIGGKDADDDR